METLEDDQWIELNAVNGSTQGETVEVAIDSCQTVRLRLERKSGYILLDDITISYLVLGNEPAEGYSDLLTSGATEYRFTGLPAGISYGYRVRGLRDGEYSMESNEIVVGILESSAIEEVYQDTGDEAIIIYDLQGRILNEIPSSGFYIVKQGHKVGKYIKK